ncbi:MAG: hypothetical protein Q8P86_00595 [bacterium]|nr:hypothetical protein [bacterium]
MRISDKSQTLIADNFEKSKVSLKEFLNISVSWKSRLSSGWSFLVNMAKAVYSSVECLLSLALSAILIFISNPLEIAMPEFLGNLALIAAFLIWSVWTLFVWQEEVLVFGKADVLRSTHVAGYIMGSWVILLAIAVGFATRGADIWFAVALSFLVLIKSFSIATGKVMADNFG